MSRDLLERCRGYWQPCNDCAPAWFSDDDEPYRPPGWERTCEGDCSEGLQCLHVPIPPHLEEYDPESMSAGKSFLVLGKLCEYLQQYTRILQFKAKHFDKSIDDHCKELEDLYNESFLEEFLQALKKLQTWSISAARKSLEILLSSKLPSTATDIVFKKLFVDWDDFEMSCRFEEPDDHRFENTYRILSSLYKNLRNADKLDPHCDHHGGGRWPDENTSDVKYAILKISLINRVVLEEAESS